MKRNIWVPLVVASLPVLIAGAVYVATSSSGSDKANAAFSGDAVCNLLDAQTRSALAGGGNELSQGGTGHMAVELTDSRECQYTGNGPTAWVLVERGTPAASDYQKLKADGVPLTVAGAPKDSYGSNSQPGLVFTMKNGFLVEVNSQNTGGDVLVSALNQTLKGMGLL